MSENPYVEAVESTPAHRALKPFISSPRLGGFDNLLSKEMGDWFRLRRFITQALRWALIINGSAGLVMVLSQTEAAQAGEGLPSMTELATTMIFSMMVIAGSIGAIIMAQDEIIGEKVSGTAAWILSKPVSRAAFILAKLLANAIGILVVVVGIPTVIGYFESWAVIGSPLPLGPYLLGAGVAALGPLFYLALAIMLGVLNDKRGPVLGICLGLLLGGSVAMNIFPALGAVLPLALQNISVALVQGIALPTVFLIELATTVVWIILFVVIALARFEKVEF